MACCHSIQLRSPIPSAMQCSKPNCRARAAQQSYWPSISDPHKTPLEPPPLGLTQNWATDTSALPPVGRMGDFTIFLPLSQHHPAVAGLTTADPAFVDLFAMAASGLRCRCHHIATDRSNSVYIAVHLSTPVPPARSRPAVGRPDAAALCVAACLARRSSNQGCQGNAQTVVLPNVQATGPLQPDFAAPSSRRDSSGGAISRAAAIGTDNAAGERSAPCRRNLPPAPESAPPATTVAP